MPRAIQSTASRNGAKDDRVLMKQEKNVRYSYRKNMQPKERERIDANYLHLLWHRNETAASTWHPTLVTLNRRNGLSSATTFGYSVMG